MRVFVTGASGWIGSALVPELIGAGHQVVGLARSDTAAAALAAAGVAVQRGTLDDLDTLREAADASDGVIHLAFKHDRLYVGDFQGAADADRRAIELFGAALAGTDRPFVIASGVATLMPGRVATERDGHGIDPAVAAPDGGLQTRHASAELVLSFATRGIRSTIVRLAPTVHGAGDKGFLARLVAIAREKGVAAYVGDGANRWPAVHRLDAAHLFRLALEQAPVGSTLHAVAEEGVPIRAVSESIGRQLGLPAVSIAPADADAHFGFLGHLIARDCPASSALTRELMGWQPTHPGLIEDLDEGHYLR
jgi:nucleoside-diphosphate-sugar epimerase